MKAFTGLLSVLATRLLGLGIAVMPVDFLVADVIVVTENSQDSSFFQMETILPPAINDHASSGKWSIVRGKSDSNSATMTVLNDGKIPANDDSPGENFFFAPGTTNGCISLDLGRSIDISEVVTYSWHAGSRGPQVYTLYASNGDQPDFRWGQLDDVEIVKAGWTRIASVDTRGRRLIGGQHASRISESLGGLGQYRYLLFEIQPTDTEDPFGHTFFSEIDVLSTDLDPVERISVPELQLLHFSSPDGRYAYTIDTTAAPELAEWSESELKPVILEWYPRIVAMLPSDGFQAPDKVRFRYLPSGKMDGIPAYAQGGTISMNAGWMSRERNREARGAIVHEMVHVVQAYQGRRQRGVRRMPTPGWIVEGIPDYVRWFLYEPESKGATLSKAARAKAKHDASYRTSANFIDWVVRNHDSDGSLLRKLNEAGRNGRYNASIWRELTGQTEEQLAETWKSE